VKKDSVETLVKKDKYQVFLFACPANLPFSFATHSWFVTNKKGLLSRWEVLFRKHACETSWGHLHKNAFLPFRGIHVFPFSNSDRYFWQNVRLIGHIGGEMGSLAYRMTDFIESSAQKYPLCNSYSLTGPNSNTYVRWVLRQFPESKLFLPWNAFGK